MARSIHYARINFILEMKSSIVSQKYDFHLIHWTSVVVVASYLTKSRRGGRFGPEKLTPPPSGRTYCKESCRTPATNWRERAPALRQHLRFGTHECRKPTWIGRKAACERERWMRTDDVKWIGQTDRRDRHNSPSKQYLEGALSSHPTPLRDTCRFPSGNIGLSSRARFVFAIRVAFEKLSATRPLCIETSNSFTASS